METFLQDLRYGARMLLKRPGFTVVAVLALALGYRSEHGDLQCRQRRPAPPAAVQRPERLVAVWETNPQLGAEMRNRNEVAMGNFLDWRAQNQILRVHRRSLLRQCQPDGNGRARTDSKRGRDDQSLRGARRPTRARSLVSSRRRKSRARASSFSVMGCGSGASALIRICGGTQPDDQR